MSRGAGAEPLLRGTERSGDPAPSTEPAAAEANAAGVTPPTSAGALAVRGLGLTDPNALARRARWDALHQKLGPRWAEKLPASIVAELRTHARREARLAQVELVALKGGDQGLTALASQLRERERMRHEARLEQLVLVHQRAERDRKKEPTP